MEDMTDTELAQSVSALPLFVFLIEKPLICLLSLSQAKYPVGLENLGQLFIARILRCRS